MNLEQLKNYTLIEKKDLNDFKSKGYLLSHNKTKARVMLIDNDDDNKVFTIAFRTPPENSTGIAHILEHSVLCGSKNFPLKDPFVELVKGSLNTFLNAITYSDKTCYPVASCNNKDFKNLMNVYLDAVFYPNIYDKKEIFLQEGWNYQIENENDPIVYNGVVYNEMKGAFSSADGILDRKIMDCLFPDTIYGNESGGDPENIPDLTYEEFLDFHKKYYHPSNSYIYLYGNMDFEERLEYLDKEYLSKFDYLEVDSDIKIQKPFDEVKREVIKYPLSDDESLENNSYLSYNVVMNSENNTLNSLAFNVLEYALLSSPGAPLKKALLNKKIAEDIYGYYDNIIMQPYFSIIAKGSNLKDLDVFVKTVDEEINKAIKNGIDQEALIAGLNIMEFKYREDNFGRYPKGLLYFLDIMNSWLYKDEKPFEPIDILKDFKTLKTWVGTDKFEKLLEENFVKNTHKNILCLEPEKGLSKKKEEELAKKLAEFKDSLTVEEINALIKQTIALKEYQNEEDPKEVVETIPLLDIKDIDENVPDFVNEKIEVAGRDLIFHDIETNGIGYMDLLFDLSKLDNKYIPYVSLLKTILGYVDTENYSYGQLNNVINTNTGGISCTIDTISNKDSNGFKAFFHVVGGALYSKYDQLFSLFDEIINRTIIDNKNRLYEIVLEIKSRLSATMQQAGHVTALTRAASYQSSYMNYKDLIDGIGYYNFIEGLYKDYDNKYEELVSNLKFIQDQIINKKNLILSFTGTKEGLDIAVNHSEKLINTLCDVEVIEGEFYPQCTQKNEGFITSGQVQYVAMCGNYKDKGFEYTGALNILSKILRYDYLWMNLRVQGGAYGCMSGFGINGDSYLVSYRDPHLKRTLKVYKEVVEYIKNFEVSNRDLTKYIIGAISELDSPLTPKDKGQRSLYAYLSNNTIEEVKKHRKEILKATIEDIRDLHKYLQAIIDSNNICVVGSESKIESDKDALMEIKSLIN